jgi:hypothetical protein
VSPAAKPKRVRRPRQTKAQRIVELEEENASLRETAAIEQSTRVALEQIINAKLDDILKAVKRG